MRGISDYAAALVCYLTLVSAAVNHFGWWDGLAITATVYLLMPYRRG